MKESIGNGKIWENHILSPVKHQIPPLKMEEPSGDPNDPHGCCALRVCDFTCKTCGLSLDTPPILDQATKRVPLLSI